MNVSNSYVRMLTVFLTVLLAMLSSSAHALIKRNFFNPSFELPVLSSSCYVQVGEADIPGWLTTHPVGNGGYSCSSPAPGSNARLIEMWSNNFNSTPAKDGNQFVELNAATASSIYQNICLVPGENINWGFSHRGRDGVDAMKFTVGGTLPTGGNNTINGGDTVQNASDGKAWRNYSGIYTVPVAYGGDQFIGFTAVSTNGGNLSVGNFIDDIKFDLKPVVEFSSGNFIAAEGDSNPPSITVTLVGVISAPLTLKFSVASTSATIGTDFTINGGSAATFTKVVAAGDYGVNGTTISIPVTIIDDTLVEGDETFTVTLSDDPTYTILSTSACGQPANKTSTYTIKDNEIGLKLTKTWVNAAINDKATLTTTGGGTGASNINSGSTADTANETDSSNVIVLLAGNSRTLNEVLNPANGGSYAASAWSCDAGTLSGNVLTVGTAQNGTTVTCGITNTRKTALITLKKTWSGAAINDTTTVSLKRAGVAVDTLLSTATTASKTDTDATPFTANVGETLNVSEAFGGSNAGQYTQSLVCDNGAAVTVGATGDFDVPATATTCTVTNTRKTSTLQTTKVWGANSSSSDSATVPATTGGSANTTAFTTVGGTNKTSGTAVTVATGNTLTFPAETGTNIANYNTVLSCLADGAATANALSGTNGQVSNTLVIGAADSGKALVCTYTNNIKGNDLAIDKTGTGSVTQGGSVSYSIKIWNKGPTVASSSTFTDTVPAGITNVTWSCSASGSAVCNTASGTGNNISVTTGALPLNNVATAPTTGSYLTFNVTGTAASVGNISNTASIAVTSGTDPVTTNNSSSASTTVSTPAAISSDTPQKEARFSITPNLPTIYRGQAGTQLVTIKNEGLDDASGTVATFKPRAQTGVTVTSVKVAGGSACSLIVGAWSCPVGSVANGSTFQLEVGYDTTASATLGTAIQADIKVASNEFNPGSGVGETLYKVWGSNTTNETRPNGAFWAGFKGPQGDTPSAGYDDETTPIINAWPIGQASPTGSYLVTAVPGINNNVYAASSTTASPMINRIITNMSTDPDRTVTLPSLASTSAGDNRRAWEFRTGVYVPQATNVTLCIGNTSVGIDDGAYIVLDNQVIGTQDSYAPGGYVSATVAFTAGYHTLSYRILNQNTQGGSAEVAQGLYGAIGILYNGNCNVAGFDAWVNTQIPASINIIEKPQVTITGQVFEDNSGTTTVNSNAYNGIKDAGELAIADSTVTINNCTNTTAIATTQTNANGEYTFNLLPTALPAGNFCIAQKNLDGYSSVSGTTGYNRVTDQITVSNTGASSYANHNFGDARLNAILTEDGQQTTIAGGVADYPHRLTAQSVLTVTSLGQTSTQQPANSTDAPWQSLLYRDLNCNGKVDAGENLISASLPLSLKANEQLCLVQRVYAPATASMGAQHIGQLQASFNIALANPTETITGTSIKRQDTTLLGSAGLSMQKMVRSVASCPSTAADITAFTANNQAQSGGYLEYEITYRNNSLKNLVDISIKDTVPVGTVFQSNGCNVTPAGTCTASKTDDALLWQNTGTLLPSQQGKVRFCVQIP